MCFANLYQLVLEIMILLLLLLPSLCIYIFSSAQSTWISQDGAIVPSLYGDDNSLQPLSFIGRGSMTLHACFSTQPFISCSVFYTEYVNHKVLWSLQARLTPSMTSSINFGAGVAADTQTAVIGSPGSSVSVAYVFKGSWSQWSEHQILTVSDLNPISGSDFGSVVAMYNQLLLISAPSNNDRAGSVYFFSRDVVSMTWSLQQKLYSKNPSLYEMFGSSAQVGSDRAAIVGAGRPGFVGAFEGSIYIFQYQNNFWSQQQILSSLQLGGYIVYVAMYGSYVAIGSPFVDVTDQNGMTLPWAGVVNIYVTDDTFPLQYTFQQRLVDVNAEANGFFGNSMSMYGSTLFIGATHYGPNFDDSTSSATYIYSRGNQSSWSCQQTLADPNTAYSNFINPLLNGAQAFVTDDQPAAYFYSATTTWNCLIVSLYDQFGDGWGDAKMLITAPDDTFDLYANLRRSLTPFSFRYCPSLPTDTGIYTISTPNATMTSFYWEIHWTVTPEATGVTYHGDHSTRMRFYFNSTILSFNFSSGDNMLGNKTCQICASPPILTPKPKIIAKPIGNGSNQTNLDPTSVRSPDSKSKTKAKTEMAPISAASTRRLAAPQKAPPPPMQYPTVSPSNVPVYTQNISNPQDWHWFRLSDVSGGGWWRRDDTGTSYYVSDVRGTMLISTGTLCPNTFNDRCWISVPDGMYVLRVAGSLDVDSANHTWSFCGQTGGAQSHLLFRIDNNNCEPLILLSSETYCSGGSMKVSLQANLILSGVFFEYGITDEGSAKLNQILDTVLSALGGIDVTIDDIDMSGSENGIIQSFSMSFSSQYNMNNQTISES